MPIAGSGSTLIPAVLDSTTNSDGALALEVGGDDEQLTVAGSGDERLDAVQHVAAAGGPRRGLQREGVKQRLGLHDRQRRGGDALADELGQIGRLLLGVAPQAERGRDGGGGQAGGGDPHVALGERLAHQHGGGRGALLDGAAELLGHADHGQAELAGLGEQLLGRRAGRVGVGRRPGGSGPARTRAWSRAASAARRRARDRTGPCAASAAGGRGARAAGRRRRCVRRGRRCVRSSGWRRAGGARRARAGRAGRWPRMRRPC